MTAPEDRRQNLGGDDLAAELPAADRLAIQEVLARFYLALEARDPAGVAATMSEDGVLVMRAGSRSSPSRQSIGSEAIRSAVAAYLAERSGSHIRHLLSNFTFEPYADRVEFGCAILALETANALSMVGVATADCTAVRTDGRWSICRFDHYLDPPDRAGD